MGGGYNPKFPINKIILWDESKGKAVLELEFKSEVRNVCLRRDRIVVVMRNKVHVYLFSSPPKKLFTIDTSDNERGLVSLSPDRENCVMAVPGRQPGHIQLVDLSILRESPSFSSLSSLNYRNEMSPRTSIIAAHTSRLSALAISRDGRYVASASETGTIIRVWDVQSCALMAELRRGLDRAEICSIVFSQIRSGSITKLLVASDKGTIHVFELPRVSDISCQEREAHQQKVLDHSPVYTRVLSKYFFTSDRSFAQAKVQSQYPPSRYVLGWVGDSSFVALTNEGKWYMFTLPATLSPSQPSPASSAHPSCICTLDGYRDYISLAL